MGAWDHRKLGSKRTSASVGNLTALSPVDLRERPLHPISRLSSRVSPGPWSGRNGEVIVAAPVRERKGSHRIFSSHSIEEEVDEDEMPRREDVLRNPITSTANPNTPDTTLTSLKSLKAKQSSERASSSQSTWSAANTTNTSRTTTASQTVQFPSTSVTKEYPSRLNRGTSA